MVCIVRLYCSPLFSPTHIFAYLTERLSCHSAEYRKFVSHLRDHVESTSLYQLQSFFCQIFFSLSVTGTVNCKINSFCSNSELKSPVTPMGSDCLCRSLVIIPTSVSLSFQETGLRFSEFGVR